MSTQDSRGTAAGGGLRDRRVARVLDREIAPVWHDRFARLVVRNLPNLPDILALDIHCGTGRTTAELLHRLGAGAKVLAIDPDEGALELAKTRIKPEWKNRVYFKPGHFDDVTAMADDSYNLVVANLVLGESVDLQSAVAEMIRVSKIGGRVLATVPLHGTWDEVEDIFAEILRDAGMTAALRRLEALRAIRPTGPQLGGLLRKQGVEADDYVIEQERFQLLFPSGREFLFAPVIEHGPLQLWKAVIGKDGSPQELFWRLKEAIDTYYSGHVLAVTINAGLLHVEVAKGTTRPGPRLAARFWRHYPELDKLWGGLAVGYAKVSDPILPFSEADIGDFDLDIDLDEAEQRRRTGSVKALRQPAVETPAPEDFGLRFRVRDSSESSGARPLESDASGVRPRSPSSEASGLRALSQIRDDGEASGVRLPARALAEDDFSDVAPAPSSARKPAADDGIPDIDHSASIRIPVPAPRKSGLGDSSINIDLSASIDANKLAARAAPEDSPPEDDFSSLNDEPKPARKPEPRAARSEARPEPSSKIPRSEIRAEDSARSARPEPSSRIPRSEIRTEDPARPEPSSRIPRSEVRTEDSTRSARPEPSSTIPRSEIREDSVRAARPEPASKLPASPPREDSVRSKTPKPEDDFSDVAPAAREDARAAKPDVPEDDFSSLNDEPVRSPARRAQPARPVETRRPEPEPPVEARPEPAPPAAEPEPPRPVATERKPAVEPRPSLPTFRLPPKPAGEAGTFRPPTAFKPPAPPSEEREPPAPPKAFKPPAPAQPVQPDEPEELDELEPVEELEPLDEPKASTPAKPPPPKPAPPPLGFKPRPLAPIIPPTDKKK